MSITAGEFKSTLARWPSGVSVVTARQGERLTGMTVSAFCSVSLSPPLILICAANTSETCAMIQGCGRFAVNVLASAQREISQRFADPELEGQRFDDLEFHFGKSGMPILAQVAASLECKLVHNSVQGDHHVLIGEVEHAEHNDRSPLLFHRGKYHELAD
jgi:flavin reductase (DIM6/NTAB) family NADH-FMN oxidoreductase RutF